MYFWVFVCVFYNPETLFSKCNDTQISCMFEKEHIQRLSWYCISLSQFHISSLQDKASLSVVQYVHSNVKRNAKLKRNNRRTASSKYSHTKNLFHLFYSCNSNPERVQRYPGRVQMFWQRIHKSCTLTKYHTWIIRKILKTQDHLQKALVFTLKTHLSWMSVLMDPQNNKGNQHCTNDQPKAFPTNCKNSKI